MKLKLIKTKEDYHKALKRLDEIFHSKKRTKEQDELEILVMLIQRYEDETVGEFPDPDPIEALKFKMEQMDLSQKDLAEVIGLKSSCLLYTSPSPRDRTRSRMPSSA